jgi:hypothetical protein
MTRETCAFRVRKAHRPAAVLLCTIMMPAAFAGRVSAQHAGHSGYAGSGSAEVKTLTPDEVTSLREGEGMGLARPAEMNGYPGPRHVLELADSLRLDQTQKARVQVVFDQMLKRARELGEQIIESEKGLDAAFAARANAASLQASVTRLARLQGELRWTHLEAHLRLMDILSEHQRHEYDRLRGYGSPHHDG